MSTRWLSSGQIARTAGVAVTTSVTSNVGVIVRDNASNGSKDAVIITGTTVAVLLGFGVSVGKGVYVDNDSVTVGKTDESTTVDEGDNGSALQADKIIITMIIAIFLFIRIQIIAG
jgi:hypothetical protein